MHLSNHPLPIVLLTQGMLPQIVRFVAAATVFCGDVLYATPVGAWREIPSEASLQELTHLDAPYLNQLGHLPDSLVLSTRIDQLGARENGAVRDGQSMGLPVNLGRLVSEPTTANWAGYPSDRSASSHELHATQFDPHQLGLDDAWSPSHGVPRSMFDYVYPTARTSHSDGIREWSDQADVNRLWDRIRDSGQLAMHPPAESYLHPHTIESGMPIQVQNEPAWFQHQSTSPVSSALVPHPVFTAEESTHAIDRRDGFFSYLENGLWARSNIKPDSFEQFRPVILESSSPEGYDGALAQNLWTKPPALEANDGTDIWISGENAQLINEVDKLNLVFESMPKQGASGSNTVKHKVCLLVNVQRCRNNNFKV